MRSPTPARCSRAGRSQPASESVQASSSTWTYATLNSHAWRGNLRADRCQLSTFAQQAIEYGLATRAELSDIAAGLALVV